MYTVTVCVCVYYILFRYSAGYRLNYMLLKVEQNGHEKYAKPAAYHGEWVILKECEGTRRRFCECHDSCEFQIFIYTF